MDLKRFSSCFSIQDKKQAVEVCVCPYVCVGGSLCVWGPSVCVCGGVPVYEGPCVCVGALCVCVEGALCVCVWGGSLCVCVWRGGPWRKGGE